MSVPVGIFDHFANTKPDVHEPILWCDSEDAPTLHRFVENKPIKESTGHVFKFDQMFQCQVPGCGRIRRWGRIER